MFADVDEQNSFSVLIADDDHAFRGTLSEMFRPACAIWEAASGEEAIEIAAVQRVDLALLDMQMDVLTGLETVEQIHEIHAETPCILITGEASDALRKAAIDARAWEVLPKPIRRGELFRTVAQALRLAYPHRKLPAIF